MSTLDAHLLRQFTDAFGRLDPDGMVLSWSDPPPPELADGHDDSPCADPRWKPSAIHTPAKVLDELYERLPARFPPLYEQLVLSYRWLEVELIGFRLLANPPGPALSSLLAPITADPTFVEVLLPQGLIPFGKAPDVCYDPICFDTSRRDPSNGDCPIVRVEHEAVLCHLRIGQSWQIAASFRSLVEDVVRYAQRPVR